MFSYFGNHSTAVLGAEMVRSYDKFILECLGFYGITKDNVFEYRNRVFIDRTPAIYNEEHIIERDRYFIDNKYCFTIEKEITTNINSCRYVIGYDIQYRCVKDDDDGNRD